MTPTPLRTVPCLGAALASLLCVLCALGCNGELKEQPAPSTTMTTPDVVAPDKNNEPEPGPTVEIPAGPMAGRSPMRLLTRYEYDNTLSELFGRHFHQTSTFPSENLAAGFENNAWAHNVNPPLVRQYMEAAERVGALLWANPGQDLSSCGTSGESAACLTQIEALLPRAYRRPVSQDETAIVRTAFARGQQRGGAQEAFASGIEAIVQAPQFLYRLELYEASPSDRAPADGGMTREEFELVGPYEMASRLSYFLWASMPDQALLDAASRGELSTTAQLEAQLDRMLEDARAREMVTQFHRQWLHTEKLDATVKDQGYYPGWRAPMSEDWRISLEAFIEHAFWDQGTLEALLTSETVFLTPALAQLYDEPVPADHGGVWAVQMPADQRSGLLTQPGLMAMLAYPNQSSPIARALFVRHKLLCQTLPDPPSNIEIKPPDPDPSLTTRETFAIHTEDTMCAGCHTLIDPLGFGFEGYDAVGRWRATENGKPIDVSGDLVSSPDKTINGPFEGVVDLTTRLATSEAVASCLASQWFTFALGRPSDESDAPSLERIHERWGAEGRRFTSLLRAIVLSDSFRYRRRREHQIMPGSFKDTTQGSEEPGSTP